jgi:hypothetical protein
MVQQSRGSGSYNTETNRNRLIATSSAQVMSLVTLNFVGPAMSF